MKKASVTFIAAVMFFSSLAVPSFGSEVLKVAVFDINEVAERSEAGKDAKAALKKEFKQREDDLKKRAKEIEQSKKQLERERPAIESDLAEKKAGELRLKIADLKNRTAEYRRQLQTKQTEFKREIFEEVSILVQKMGREEGYTIVLMTSSEQRTPNVFYSGEDVDITDKVIKAYDAYVSDKATDKN